MSEDKRFVEMQEQITCLQSQVTMLGTQLAWLTNAMVELKHEVSDLSHRHCYLDSTLKAIIPSLNQFNAG